MKNGERIETLLELGMTFDQAKTYLTLLRAGPATAKVIAQVSKIARPDIYRIIPTLQKEGAVEKLMTRPATFQATPAAIVLPSMLKRKAEVQSKLKKKTKEFLGDFKNFHAKDLLEVDSEFAIVPEKEALIQRLKETLLKTQICLDVVTSQRRFSAAILEFEGVYRKALEKGVKIRIATDRHVPLEKVLGIVKNFTRDYHFEVKYFDNPPPTIVTIFDNKEVLVTLTAKAQFAETSSIWSNNTSFIALAQSYFENAWNRASILNNTVSEKAFIEARKADF